MAKLADILPIERDRQEPEKWNVIHLFKTGTFYSAYEWSAWLTAVISFNDEVRMQTRERQPLAVTRNTIASADGETFCKVGFPIRSVDKFIPNRTDFTPIDDSHLTITIELPQPTDGSEVTYERLSEVFAAMFRDRIVHHLYFNYTHQLFERTFIADSYSCIEGRGTHYGIDRLRQHIRQTSLNWTQPCYAMNLDIRGYFMHINREKLLKIATESLTKMATHKVGLTDDVPIPRGVIMTKSTTWSDIRDMRFILWLTEQIIMLDPMENCIIVGDESDWDGMDHAKCMRYVLPGLGLPIGNLTSQLFSNVYLNPFDQFVKRDILCEHYGRYVDDSTMVDACREWLLAQVPRICEFMADELGLQLHMGKLHVRNVRHGVEFLGAFVKPYRDYISNKTLNRITHNLQMMNLCDREHVMASVNSYLGVLSHTASYHLRQEIAGINEFAKVIEIDADYLKCRVV